MKLKHLLNSIFIFILVIAMSRCNVSNDLSKNSRKGSKSKNSEKKINDNYYANKILPTKKNSLKEIPFRKFLLRQQKLFVEGYSRRNYNAIIPREMLDLFNCFIGDNIEDKLISIFVEFIGEGSKLSSKSIFEKKCYLQTLKKYVDQGVILRIGFLLNNRSRCRRVMDLPYMNTKLGSDRIMNTNQIRLGDGSLSFCCHYKIYNKIVNIDDTKATYINDENNEKDPYPDFNEVTLYHECDFDFAYVRIANS